MSVIPLYIDHHVHFAITHGLRLRGVHCITAEEDHRQDEDDEELLVRATSLGRVLVTQDEDFLAISADWNRLNRSFAGIVYSHQLGITIGQAVHDLEKIAKTMRAEDLINIVVYIPF